MSSADGGCAQWELDNTSSFKDAMKFLPTHRLGWARRCRAVLQLLIFSLCSAILVPASHAADTNQQKDLVPTEARSIAEQAETDLSLIGLARNYSDLGLYDKAVPLLFRALDIREKNFGPEHPAVADCLEILGSLYGNLRQHDKSLPLQLRAFSIRQKALGTEHPLTAASLTSISLTYVRQKQYELTLPLLHNALAIQGKILGPEHPDMWTSLSLLANAYSGLAQYEQALPLRQRALAIEEKKLGPEHPKLANSLHLLAGIYSDLARYDHALPLLLRALAIREKALGPEHPDTAASLNTLAHAHSDLAEYDKALPLELRALAIREKVLGPEHPDTAIGLDSVGNAYRTLGQLDKALPLQLRALAIREKVLSPKDLATAESFNNLANTYADLGQYDKALHLQQRALTIFEITKGPDHPDSATYLSNLAVSYSNLAQHDKALPLQLRALAIREKVLGTEHPDTAVSLYNLAVSYRELGEYERAFPLQGRALAIQGKVLGADHPATARSLTNLAFLFKLAKQDLIAVILYKAAVNSSQSQRQNVSRIGPEALTSYSKAVAVPYQALAELLTDLGRIAEAQAVLDMPKEDEQFDFIRRSNDADPRRARMGYTPIEATWMNRYRQIADQLGALGAEEQALQKQAKLGLTPAQQARLKAIKDDLAVANKAFTSFLDEMQKGFAAQGPARAIEVEETSAQNQRELQALIRQLGPDVALLQYYVTAEKVGIILTTPGVVLPFSSVVDAKVLNRQIREYRAMLSDRTSNPLPAAQALYQLLIAPVAQALEQAGIKTVMLSLDGNLRHVPFGALHDGKQYLAQRWSLPLYTTVTRDKLRDAVTPRWKTAGLGVTRALGQFKALPAVKRELNDVMRATASGGEPGEVYLDEQFTAGRLKEVGQRSFQLMHVSSHFTISPGTEVNSFLLLGDGQHLTLGDIRTQNYRFDQVDLLTLAACDTGLGGGRDANGKEIEGLGVIAQQQGAKAVLATLWPVHDQSTATLMADMYQRRQQQALSKIEALRQAQLALMAQPKYAHPFYWAPFILMGNWK